MHGKKHTIALIMCRVNAADFVFFPRYSSPFICNKFQFSRGKKRHNNSARICLVSHVRNFSRSFSQFQSIEQNCVYVHNSCCFFLCFSFNLFYAKWSGNLYPSSRFHHIHTEFLLRQFNAGCSTYALN